MACLLYQDSPSCKGYEHNKLCSTCDKNARLSPFNQWIAETHDEKITMMEDAVKAAHRGLPERVFHPTLSGHQERNHQKRSGEYGKSQLQCCPPARDIQARDLGQCCVHPSTAQSPVRRSDSKPGGYRDNRKTA
jgi:hypothetical protein